MSFKNAIGKVPELVPHLQDGLGALRHEDRPHIVADEPRRLQGSVDIDKAYLAAQPNANRWDFAIGFRHHNRTEDTIYWVEIHTASDSQVSVVARKFQWLKEFLRSKREVFERYEQEFFWVASGSTSFTQTSQQARKYALGGLRLSGKVLRLRNEI